jgi:hypothetical protein
LDGVAVGLGDVEDVGDAEAAQDPAGLVVLRFVVEVCRFAVGVRRLLRLLGLVGAGGEDAVDCSPRRTWWPWACQAR